MNGLFVGYKPTGMSSAQFLGYLKRKYKNKKAGFSGTLDPFAKGCLIIAFGKYTKLFQYLNIAPKVYRATLWLGAFSETLDIEGISSVQIINELNDISFLEKKLKGDIEFEPPKFCAKKINGKRAYLLARNNIDFSLKKEIMHIYDFKMINYSHPFLSFEASVSKGAYVRSIGEIIANMFGVHGALSFLERTREGQFFYENEKFLNPYEYINLKENKYLGNLSKITLGKKLNINEFAYKEDNIYKVLLDDEFIIIEIKDEKVIYKINRIPLC